jgi:hemolysin activation/secretion protein
VRSCVIASSVLLAAPGLAQQAPARPSLPRSAVPSREEVTPPAPEGARAPRPSVTIDTSRTFRIAPCPLEQSDVKASITKLRFSSATDKLLPPEIEHILADIAPPKSDGPTPIAVVCDLRDQATARLRRAGYIASVQIPPQSLDTGELLLQVVTARIVEVHVEGDAGSHRGALLQRIEQLKKLDPLNERDAERVLLLSSDIPGVDVQLALRPAGTGPGQLIGDLTIISRRFAVLGNIQNYGSHQLGRWTAYVRGEAYGVLTPSDLLYAGVSTTFQTQEQKIAQVGYVTGIGSNGLTLGGRFTYAWSRPDLGDLDIRSRTLIGGIDLIQPLLRRVNGNLSVAGGFELIEQRTRLFDKDKSSVPLNRDKIRVLYGRLSGNHLWRRRSGAELFSLSGSVEIRKGLDILNATKRGSGASGSGYTPSRFEGDPEALVIRANVDAALTFGLFQLASGVKAQWSNHPLLNYEEFALGNLSVGRGYDPGANSADRAVGWTNELRFNWPGESRLPTQLFGFYDQVDIWNLDTGSTETGRRLRSWGAGVRVVLPGRVVLEGVYAHPADRALSIDDKPPPDRFLLSLTVRFSPEGHR